MWRLAKGFWDRGQAGCILLEQPSSTGGGSGPTFLPPFFGGVYKIVSQIDYTTQIYFTNIKMPAHFQSCLAKKITEIIELCVQQN